jgi:predicted O-methyltransferase YrrM
MSTQFGFLARFELLQNMASFFFAMLNPAIIHNLEKYAVIKKVIYLTSIEEIDGDYLEFGTFTGSSISHAIRCAKKAKGNFPASDNIRFYGYDSFEGFGELSEDDKHAFYTDQNFNTDYDRVLKRVKKVAGNCFDVKLIKGFFNESLIAGTGKHGISKARIVFIDCDTKSSADDALKYCTPVLQAGTYIIVDDFFSYKGSSEKGVAAALNEFTEKNNLRLRQVFTYGMGGCVFVIDKL